MDNPGGFSLAAVQLGAALSAVALTPITDLDGMTAVTIEFDFKGGTGGSSATAVVQTSLDKGTTWRDIARADFANTAAVKHCNLEGLLSKGITSYADLAAEGVYDGVLGSQLRAVITSVGTYSDTTLAVRVSVR